MRHDGHQRGYAMGLKRGHTVPLTTQCGPVQESGGRDREPLAPHPTSPLPTASTPMNPEGTPCEGSALGAMV